VSGYNLALFLHICGAVALFSILALLLGTLAGARRAGTSQAAREWATMAWWMAALLPLAAVWLFVAAAFMVSQRDWWQRAWVQGAMLVVLLLLLLDLALVLPRVAELRRAAATAHGTEDDTDLSRRAHDPLLWLAGQMISTTATGVIALMVFKPGDGPSAAIVLVSVGLGLLAGVPGFMRYRRLVGTAPGARQAP
jgi:hypothetical protein